jgi:hypothetical protein
VKDLRIIVLGTMGADPYAGMAWMHMQIAGGLLRLGCDVHYLETTSAWPYDPVQGMRVADPSYPTAHLAATTARFGLGDRWAYRCSWSDGHWLGPDAPRADELLRTADLVLNISGSTSLKEDRLGCPRLVYFGTDPVGDELLYSVGDPRRVAMIDEHQDIVTYGENIGTPRSQLPPLPRLRARTRQPVLMDFWESDSSGPPMRNMFTTVGNWRQDGHDAVFQGRPLRWSKHHEFLKFVEVPRRAGCVVELATNLGDPDVEPAPEPSLHEIDPNEIRGAESLEGRHARLLLANGWQLADGPALSLSPWRYRDYILSSKAEFTVAREFNVLPRSGWFSERSACYLAAGRPVIAQDTGFSDLLPTGEGLFAFSTVEEAVDAISAINADYARHAKAARAIAHDWFRAEVVLPKLLADLSV